MYGYNPEANDKVPASDKILFGEDWWHGMWLPNIPEKMWEAKSNLHKAQGKGAIPYPEQEDTNIYFAGNNTTADSLEHAFLSGVVIANYAFGVGYALWDHPYAWAQYEAIYHEIMFPSDDPTERLARSKVAALPGLK